MVDKFARLGSGISIVISIAGLWIGWRADSERRDSERASLSFAQTGGVSMFGMEPNMRTDLALAAANIGKNAALDPEFLVIVCKADVRDCIPDALPIAQAVLPASTIEVPVRFKGVPPQLLMIRVTYEDRVLRREYEDSFFVRWEGQGTLTHVGHTDRDRLVSRMHELVAKVNADTAKCVNDPGGESAVCRANVLESLSKASRAKIERVTSPTGTAVWAE